MDEEASTKTYHVIVLEDGVMNICVKMEMLLRLAMIHKSIGNIELSTESFILLTKSLVTFSSAVGHVSYTL